MCEDPDFMRPAPGRNLLLYLLLGVSVIAELQGVEPDSNRAGLLKLCGPAIVQPDVSGEALLAKLLQSPPLLRDIRPP